MSKSKKIILGVATLLPIVFMLLYLFSFLQVFDLFLGLPEDPGQPRHLHQFFISLFVYMILAILFTIGLLVYYIVHILKNRRWM